MENIAAALDNNISLTDKEVTGIGSMIAALRLQWQAVAKCSTVELHIMQL